MTAPSEPPSVNNDAAASVRPKGTMVWIRNRFLTGLAVATPLVLTWWILSFVYGILHGWSEPLLRFFASLTNEIAGYEMIIVTDPTFVMVTDFVGFLIPIAALIALGLMATNVIGHRIVIAVDRLMVSIPVISFIYKSLKQVIDAFKSLGGKQNFKRLAYIDYPVPGMRLIGFVTGQFCDPISGKAMTSVYLPTSPSPMTGFVLVVDSDKVTDAPMSMEDGMKMVFSGGLVGPTTAAQPLNKKAALSTAEEAVVAAVDEVEEVAALPIGLPRAEDFDSGDPDILSTSETEAAELAGRSGKGLFGALSWKRRQ